jgi:choline dehydrogenase-like flavoprotein
MQADVCIVGAGAAGGVLAFELGRRGIDVGVLESGPRHDFARRREYVREYLRHENPWRSRLPHQDAHTFGGRATYDLEGRRARGIGGSTLAWEGYALRFHHSDFRLRSEHGIAEDWPIAYDDLEPFYARAETAVGVAGADDDPLASPRSGPFPLPAFPFSYSDGAFAPVCAKLGVGFAHMPQARNSIAYAGRARCQACATCHVCPTGAKASTDLTHIPGAEATGHVRIATEATVLRLETDRAGAVGAAVYAGPDGVERRMRARLFILAAGAVENARILLLSNGLANRSGLVGQRFMAQPSIDVIGRVSDNMYPYRIGFSTAVSRQSATGGDRTARAAYLLEFLNSAGGTPGDLAIRSRLTGEALRRHVQGEFGRRLGIRIYCEHLPQPNNSVSLNPRVRDHLGLPGPHVTYRVSAYEARALDEGTTVAAKILRGVGATDVRYMLMSPAAHQIGTHRMGTDPRTSVVDPNLRVHDVPNLYLVGSGCFVTSSAMPPTLTIAALAIRAADHIAARLRPGESGGGAQRGAHAPKLVDGTERLEDHERAR